MTVKPDTLENLLSKARSCQLCSEQLPHKPRPIVIANTQAKLLIIGQAPGSKVHASGIPWDDSSGNRLRDWLGISKKDFYNEEHTAIIPMGFCYPGKGSSGDLPPQKKCVRQWHSSLRSRLPNIQLTLLIGHYAQHYYLADKYQSVTESVQNWHEYMPEFFPLPHPSPRNSIWLKKHL